MELTRRTFIVQIEGQEVRGVVRRASGAERVAYLAAQDAADKSDHIAYMETLEGMRRQEVTPNLLELPGVTVDGVGLADAGPNFWEYLPAEVYQAAVSCRLGLSADVGNSESSRGDT